ncbi:MAG: tetratricopeptide repeat protein [Phycisphaerales bacterium]|nr:MAG: tetratricopeptide repeat protein [Phycisphaerales bacterium]
MMPVTFFQRAAAAVLCAAVVASMASVGMASPPITGPADGPTTGPPTVEQAREYQQAGRWEEAAEAWEQIADAEPENGTAWFNLGYCLHAAGHLERAIEVHQKAAAFEEYRGIALYNLGCALALMGKPDEAFEALFASQAAGFRMRGQAEGDSDLDSLRADPRYEALLAREKAGFEQQIQEILGRVQQILRQMPEFTQRLAMIAQQAIGRARNTFGAFQQKLAQDERFAPIAQRIQELLGGGHQGAESADAPSGPPIVEQAREYQQAGRWEEAAEAWRQVSEVEPENGSAWFNLGYCLHAAGHLEQAIEVHQKAAMFDEYHGIALYNLGCAYSLMGRLDEAMEALYGSRDAGFDLTGVIADDSDLDNLRDDPRFLELLTELNIDH